MEYMAEAVQEDGMRFVVSTGPHSLTTDYPLDPHASGAGPRPLQLLLGSLASCAGGSLIALLRRAGQPIEGLRVKARGQRRAEHPTVFTEIALEFVVRGSVDPAVVAGAIEQSEAHICPVWAMLKPTTPISSSFRIEG
ncbi:MAG TPA: OsmC family protein [Thermoanaerobaculaceae bacterium]|nr:OsmC family protein [Thermoanaerobaculaceae bacterium]HPS76930.1 OsmC family protein [Thermoanaerobaculaceae bacterium]